ncbi:hypothetical protein EC2741950_3305 [Escherichia coli 2741950]|nr:hypothetical protein EC2741950_3305 [Escherichia coli 2741950]
MYDLIDKEGETKNLLFFAAVYCGLFVMHQHKTFYLWTPKKWRTLCRL